VAVALGDCTSLTLSLLGLGALHAASAFWFAVKARRVLASSRAQRGFNFAGGSLLSAAGVWAMLARRAV
jgi:threonine/homoserine/homoserine lactone efflux protein